nr:late embryogenesis abundant protein LEA84 [Pinus tabuliformis]
MLERLPARNPSQTVVMASLSFDFLGISHCLHFLFCLSIFFRDSLSCVPFSSWRGGFYLRAHYLLCSLTSEFLMLGMHFSIFFPGVTKMKQYTAAAAEAMRSSGAAGREFPEVSKAGRGGGNNKGTVFWMRDPATGNWILEDHFGETDTAELRQKLLSSRK